MFQFLISPFSEVSLSTPFVALILVVFLIGSISMVNSYVRGSRCVTNIRKLYNGSKKSSLAQNREIFLERAEEFKVLGRWNEFDESLVLHGDQLMNTIDAGHFFNAQTLGSNLLNNRLYAALPGLLTALGVLGTFVGLSMGLSGLDSGDTVDALKEGIGQLISGAAAAFITSVWGVFFSFLFNLLEKMLERDLRSKISMVQDEIDYLFPRLTPEKTLHDIHEEAAKSAIALDGLAERISNELQTSVQQVGDSISSALVQSLNDVLAPALNKLASDAKDSSTKAMDGLVERFIDEVGKVGHDQQKVIQQASKEMSDNLDRFNQEVGASVKGMVEAIQIEAEKNSKSAQDHAQKQIAALENINGIIDQQEQRQAKVNKMSLEHSIKISNSLEAVSELNNSLLIKLKDITDKQLIVNQKLENTSESLNSATESIKASGSEFVSSAELLGTELKLASEQTKESKMLLADYHKSASALVNALDSQASRTQQASDNLERSSELSVNAANSTKAVLGEIEQLVKQRVDDLSSGLQTLLDEFTKKSSEQMSNRLNVWTDSTSRYINEMTKAMQLLSEVVDEIDVKVGQAS